MANSIAVTHLNSSLALKNILSNLVYLKLIYREPDLENQKRIWENWLEMSDEQKKISDAKSMEFFGLTNTENHKIIMEEWNKKID